MPEAIIIEPFTYYRTADGKRAFLVADADTPGEWLHIRKEEDFRIVLIEWGKTRKDAIFFSYLRFQAEVEKGNLILFMPKL